MDTATTAAITLTHHISSFGTASQLCSLLQSIDQLNRIEENFGECKRLWINYKNTFGEINFGEFERL